MRNATRLVYLDNLRTFLIFLVVLNHAGWVYEKSGMAASWWIVVDPSTSDLPGLVNLMIDIFVMPTIFFASGALATLSLDRRGAGGFVVARFRRLILPWAVAVVTLIPLYKVIFLASRGLPQAPWTTYFHWTNDGFSMGWLWFLPVLFLFDLLYALLSRLRLPTERIPLAAAVAGIFAAGLAYSVTLGVLSWYGWSKTPLVDFQNERLLPYFLVFLLGAHCRRLGILEPGGRRLAPYIAVLATAWIPMNVYIFVLLNYFLHPGEFIVSAGVDRLLLWVGYHLSMLMLLYAMVATFHHYLDRQRPLGKMLGQLSYAVYILHVPVLGLLALALRWVEIPGLFKYPLLAVGTWVATNLLAYAYRRSRARLAPAPEAGWEPERLGAGPR